MCHLSTYIVWKVVQERQAFTLEDKQDIKKVIGGLVNQMYSRPMTWIWNLLHTHFCNNTTYA